MKVSWSKSLIGEKHNRLTVISFSHKDKGGRSHWVCKCDCGNEKIVEGYSLKVGKIKSCGCLNKELSSKRAKDKLQNLVGKTFGKLKVIEILYKIRLSYYWRCLCECGNETVVRGSHLKDGSVKSCGCGRVGKNNPSYNSDLTDEERFKKRNYPEYVEWRKNVYKRDNYKCQCCGIKGKTLNAHHIFNYSKYKELRTILENGITLCEDCHKAFHSKYTNFNNTRKQLDDFIKDYKENTGESICQSA